MRRAVVSLTILAAAMSASAGCTVGVPDGKAITVDTSAWAGSAQCSTAPCALDAYRSREFTADAAIPGALVNGGMAQVHCFAPAPSPMVDPSGREVHRWYLLTVGDRLLWAPDLALTSEPDLRRDETAPGQHLAADLRVCHSGVAGR